MNNEIKEILKILKKCEFGACITKHNSRVLLDYITNLQQEKDTYKEQLRITHKDLEHYISRCEKAIEYIKNRKEEYINAGATRVAIKAWHYNKLINDLLNILQNGSDDNE